MHYLLHTMQTDLYRDNYQFPLEFLYSYRIPIPSQILTTQPYSTISYWLPALVIWGLREDFKGIFLLISYS